MAACVVNTLVLVAGAAHELFWGDLNSKLLADTAVFSGLVQSSSQMLDLDCPMATSAVLSHHDS